MAYTHRKVWWNMKVWICKNCKWQTQFTGAAFRTTDFLWEFNLSTWKRSVITSSYWIFGFLSWFYQILGLSDGLVPFWYGEKGIGLLYRTCELLSTIWCEVKVHFKIWFFTFHREIWIFVPFATTPVPRYCLIECQVEV